MNFQSIFQKKQHFDSRHQKTTPNLLRIELAGILTFNEIWLQRGAMYVTRMVEFSGASQFFFVLRSFVPKLMVSDKMIHRAVRTHKYTTSYISKTQ